MDRTKPSGSHDAAGNGGCCYQIDCQTSKKGRMFAGSKRRICWRFGFPSAEALERGRSGSDCRGEEHEVVFVWSLTSGKKFVLCDGHEVHWSKESAFSVKKTPFDGGGWKWTWESPMAGANRSLTVVAHGPGAFFDKRKINNSNSNSSGSHHHAKSSSSSSTTVESGFRRIEFLVDGVSFSELPFVFELGGHKGGHGERTNASANANANASRMGERRSTMQQPQPQQQPQPPVYSSDQQRLSKSLHSRSVPSLVSLDGELSSSPNSLGTGGTASHSFFSYYSHAAPPQPQLYAPPPPQQQQQQQLQQPAKRRNSLSYQSSPVTVTEFNTAAKNPFDDVICAAGTGRSSFRQQPPLDPQTGQQHYYHHHQQQHHQQHHQQQVVRAPHGSYYTARPQHPQNSTVY